MSGFVPVAFPLDGSLTKRKRAQLVENIGLARDAIVFFTAYAGAKGLGGHTGGAYDVVPEVLIADGFSRKSKSIYPVMFDAAGHRVALQYLLCALKGSIPLDQLLRYREYKGGLPGHPEKVITPGLDFSSGRLGHLWSFVNGVALNSGKRVVCFNSDGGLQEGDDAEAARFCVANDLDVTLVVDDNDVTISGHPSEYMEGFDIPRTLAGHGLDVVSGDGEDVDASFLRLRRSLKGKGPFAVVNRRPMAVGIEGLEGATEAHDVISKDLAVQYLKGRGHDKAARMLESVRKRPVPQFTSPYFSNRSEFGKVICDILRSRSAVARRKCLVVDSDLAGSTGLAHIKECAPARFISGGLMERNNFSVCAGFGSRPGYQGVFSTFSCFSEMVVSEITMARLNRANVLAHFSHAGVDWIADNTCHFGMNVFFTDDGFLHDDTRLFFPADALQLRAVLEEVFDDSGLRFVFSTRSAVPLIQKNSGDFFGSAYKFKKDKDEFIFEGKDGFIVSYGDMLYRAVEARESLKKSGFDVGVVNKPTLNVVDERALKKVGRSGRVLLVESQNFKTGLGIRYGSWLLQRDLHPSYLHLGVIRPGEGGVYEQIAHQGLSVKDIVERFRKGLA